MAPADGERATIVHIRAHDLGNLALPGLALVHKARHGSGGVGGAEPQQVKPVAPRPPS